MKLSLVLLCIVVVAPVLSLNDRCTNFLISAGASKDGSTMISYNADSHALYGWLANYPAADHAPGSYREIYNWEDHTYLGKIPEVNHTYNVVGNINEYGVGFAETTYGGREELTHQSGAILDYGNLIYIALQRSKTAKEAIQTVGDLVAAYGYVSEGESFSVSDSKEVWIFEIIGKGEGEKGAVWVARRVPDGYVCGHANQARIQTFPLNDSANCLYAKDVVDFAKKKGYYPQEGKPEDFSFSDTYNPVSFEGARGCEVRVWSMFRRVTKGMDEYLDYVQGYNLTHRMPLWVKATEMKVTPNDTMNFMRDHLEDTWFDFRHDVGAEAFEMPYRWRPLTWKVNGKEYLNERSTATQQTAFTFVAQSRSWLPSPIGSIIWFGVDDAATSVYAPYYGSMTRIPDEWKAGGDMMKFKFDSAFFVFNMVANWVYMRWNLIYPEVFEDIVRLEEQFFEETAVIEAKAVEVYKTDPAQAIELLTAYSCDTGSNLVKYWLEYWKYLFCKYMDGNVKTAQPGKWAPKVEWPGYPEAWLKRIVDETGDHYRTR